MFLLTLFYESFFLTTNNSRTIIKIPTVGFMEEMMTKKEDKEKRVDDILWAAVQEFVEKGYEKTSIDSIAARAGISKGGVYYHFESKEQILLAANVKLAEPVTLMMNKAQQESSAQAALRQYICEYLTYWSAHEQELVFFLLSITKVLGQPPLWQMYEEYTENMLAFFTKLFAKGITQKEFTDHAPRESAIVLLSALDGVLGYLIMDKHLNLTEVIASFEARFIQTLLLPVH